MFCSLVCFKWLSWLAFRKQTLSVKGLSSSNIANSYCVKNLTKKECASLEHSATSIVDKGRKDEYSCLGPLQLSPGLKVEKK